MVLFEDLGAGRLVVVVGTKVWHSLLMRQVYSVVAVVLQICHIFTCRLLVVS